MPLATGLGELKDLKLRLQQTFLVRLSIWMPLLQQKLQIEGSELASYNNRLCKLSRIWMPFCNRSSVTNWRIQMPLATEMSMGGTSFVGFCLSKDPKPWSLDLQWGKRETWVSLQVRERERTKVEGSVHGTMPWMSEWATLCNSF